MQDRPSGTPDVPPRVTATLWTPPHVLRGTAAGEVDSAHEVAAAVAAACDVWACAVTLFFLRRGRWPFSRSQIRLWPTTPAALWIDDAAIDFSLPGALPLLSPSACVTAVTTRQSSPVLPAAARHMNQRATAQLPQPSTQRALTTPHTPRSPQAGRCPGNGTPPYMCR